MLQVQTRKPPRTFNHHANIRTDKPTPNSMMTRVLSAVFQPLFNAETQRARRNAEEKIIFFLLSLRSSANLCVSALILRSLRANRDMAVQRSAEKRREKDLSAALCESLRLCVKSFAAREQMGI